MAANYTRTAVTNSLPIKVFSICFMSNTNLLKSHRSSLWMHALFVLCEITLSELAASEESSRWFQSGCRQDNNLSRKMKAGILWLGKGNTSQLYVVKCFQPCINLVKLVGRFPAQMNWMLKFPSWAQFWPGNHRMPFIYNLSNCFLESKSNMRSFVNWMALRAEERGVGLE